MNTPPTIKRHDYRPPPPEIPDGMTISCLMSADLGARYADVITRFEHVEDAMSHVMAVLLGGFDDQTAGYVLRTIRNPATKRELMRSLLQKAPANKTLPDTFDALLTLYEQVSSERNRLVHGLWYTHMDSGRVFLCRSAEHGFGFVEAKEVHAETFDNLAEKIGQLMHQIIVVAFPLKIDRRQRAGLPPPNLLPTPMSSGPPQSAQEATDPPPQPSEG